MLSAFCEDGEGARIDHFGHTVKIDEQREEDFVGGRAVLMYTAQVAGNGNARHIFPMESKHALCLLAQASRAIWIRYVPVKMLVLTVIRSGDFGQKTSDHFDDVLNRHRADLILLTSPNSSSQRVPRRVSRSCQDFLTCKTLDMVEVADFDSAGRGLSRAI